MQITNSIIQRLSTMILLLVGVLVWMLTWSAVAVAADYATSVHGDSTTGVNRTSTGYSIGDCAHCHDTFDEAICGVNSLMLFAEDEALCFNVECHPGTSDEFNPISEDQYAGLGTSKGYYGTVNTKHDVLDSDQTYSGTVMECNNCHDVHSATKPSVDPSENIIIDPDDRSIPFTGTMTHPGIAGGTVMDSITFCLKCHDNTWPTDVTGPTPIIDIADKWLLTQGGDKDEHGAAEGSQGGLLGPYLGVSNPVPPIPCTDCHDEHGAGGIYHLKPLMSNQEHITGNPDFLVTITSANMTTADPKFWCSHCHDDPMNQISGGNKTDCITSGCHSHSSGSF